jgi:arabinofuranan 3-O-arabinosyltransferase
MHRGDDLVVPARAEASLLVINHNFNAGWRATTAAGGELEPVRVNGWQQGYVVQAGAGTTVREDFAPTGTYRLMLLLGLVALVALGGYTWARRRNAGPPGPSLTPRGGARRPQWLLAAAVLVALSGIWGIAALAVAEVLVRTVRRGVPWLVLAAGVAAGGLVALGPWLGGGAAVDSAAAQALVLISFALVVRRGSCRRPQRMMGRSRA